MKQLAKLQTSVSQSIWQCSEVGLAWVQSTEALSCAKRLSIYRDSLLETLKAVLSEHYPILKKLVGAPFFKKMLHDYCACTPSTSPNLDTYGSQLAYFMTTYPPLKHFAYLADVAALEWAWYRTLLTDRHTPVETLLYSPYPVWDIWRVNRHEEQVTTQISLDQGPSRIVVWTEGKDTLATSLEETKWVERCLQAKNNANHLNKWI